MTGPNRSSAVMQQRKRDDVPDPLDYFPTPPWATRALCEFLIGECGESIGSQRAWEPACGEGYMTGPLIESFDHVTASDVYRYSPDHGICDFLADGPLFIEADWIITNPPFKVGKQFVKRSIDRARRGTAMFVRSAFTEGQDRYEQLFAPPVRPAFVVQFAERVVLLKGRLIQDGQPDPFNLDDDGRPRKASSATAYSWVIWIPGQHDTRHRTIPPCRRRLERPGDYPDYSHLFPAKEGALL